LKNSQPQRLSFQGSLFSLGNTTPRFIGYGRLFPAR